MLVRELASQKVLVRTGRKGQVGKRRSHGFGRERGLLETPEKVEAKRKLKYELGKVREKTDVNRLEEILAKMSKKDRQGMNEEIMKGIEDLISSTSLVYREELETFKKIVEAAKKPKNRELREALKTWSLELRTIKERETLGKAYLLIYIKWDMMISDPEEAERKNRTYVIERIVEMAKDERLIFEKIRIPTEGSLSLEGKQKRVTITRTGIKEKGIEVLEIEIEEKN